MRVRLALLAASLAATAAAVELLFHLAPQLLPGSFRAAYPPHGIEFFRRGLLDATPLDAVPLPYGAQPYDGPPPHDLIDLGIAPRDAADGDATAVPRLVLPADAEGLPNVERPERPDVVFVGDSFAVLAAQREPAGLQLRVERELRARVLNVAISGLGPAREAWLLEQRGLPARPRLVVWFYFGGNDLSDTLWLMLAANEGRKTWGDLAGERRAPRLILPSLLASLFASAGARPEPLPALALPGGARAWFSPDALRVMTLPKQPLQQHPVWQQCAQVLRRAHERTVAAGAQFLLVYVPCKEQLYLPLVAGDGAALHRYAKASALYTLPLPDDSGALVQALLDNRGAQEAAVRELCEQAGIPMWSATAPLDAALQAGTPIYYTTDTHWRAEGQAAVATPLLERLRATGLFAH